MLPRRMNRTGGGAAAVAASDQPAAGVRLPKASSLLALVPRPLSNRAIAVRLQMDSSEPESVRMPTLRSPLLGTASGSQSPAYGSSPPSSIGSQSGPAAASKLRLLGGVSAGAGAAARLSACERFGLQVYRLLDSSFAFGDK